MGHWKRSNLGISLSIPSLSLSLSCHSSFPVSQLTHWRCAIPLFFIIVKTPFWFQGHGEFCMCSAVSPVGHEGVDIQCNLPCILSGFCLEWMCGFTFKIFSSSVPVQTMLVLLVPFLADNELNQSENNIMKRATLHFQESCSLLENN